MCIDPQQQALNWIKKKEENNNLKVKKKTHAHTMIVIATHIPVSRCRQTQNQYFGKGHNMWSWQCEIFSSLDLIF